MDLQNEESLENSDVVANSRMNRQRGVLGVNSYEKDLKLNLIDWLQRRIEEKGSAKWLDLCCGQANALIDVVAWFQSIENPKPPQIVGIDLVDMFSVDRLSALDSPPENLSLVVDSLATWKPDSTFDLITCVHGLHYIGDKLGLIERAVSWLTDEGRFIANIDLNNIRLESPDGKPILGVMGYQAVLKTIRAAGLDYNSKHHLIDSTGNNSTKFGLEFIGADDQAGPNYTGQEVVDSYYRSPTAPSC